MSKNKTKIKFILFDWGGTLGKSKHRKQFIYGKNLTAKCDALQPDTVHTLKCISNMNIPMGILSNTKYTKEEMDKGLAKTKLNKYFLLGLYSSDEDLCRKPCTKIFMRGLTVINNFVPNIKPSEILYVGDNYISDVYGANSVGFQTAYITGEHSIKTALAKELGSQTYTLTKLSDLCDVISGK